MIIIPYQVHYVIGSRLHVNYSWDDILELAERDLMILKTIIGKKSFRRGSYTFCKYEIFDDLLKFI